MRGTGLALTVLWTGRGGEASGHAPANKWAAGLGAQRSPRSKDNAGQAEPTLTNEEGNLKQCFRGGSCRDGHSRKKIPTEASLPSLKLLELLRKSN